MIQRELESDRSAAPHRRLFTATGPAGSSAAPAVWSAAGLGLPFDAARAVHAAAARAGLIQKSILESRDFEHTLSALEHFTLGPWARHV